MDKKGIFRQSNLDLSSKFTIFNRVLASAVSNHLAKTASKSLYPFTDRQTHRYTDTQTDRQTDTQRQTAIKNNHNPSTISWRCKEQTNKYKDVNCIQTGVEN